MPFFLVTEEHNPKVLLNMQFRLPTQTLRAKKAVSGFPQSLLCQFFIVTTPAAEASPYDRFCGIGFDIYDPNLWKHLDSGNWGLNECGMALTYVRDEHNAYYKRKGYSDTAVPQPCSSTSYTMGIEQPFTWTPQPTVNNPAPPTFTSNFRPYTLFAVPFSVTWNGVYLQLTHHQHPGKPHSTSSENWQRTTQATPTNPSAPRSTSTTATTKRTTTP